MTGYEWLKSEYGGEVHAFNPAAHPDRPYLEAPCEHSAPRAKLHPHVNTDPFCLACLIAVGEKIPESQDWRQ